MNPLSPGLRRLAAGALGAASALLAVRLFVPAAALAFSPREAEAWAAGGLPRWAALALAGPEMAGALLLAIPRTFYLGASLLTLDLAGAIGVHRALGEPTGRLWVLLAAVALLALLRARAGAGNRFP